MKEIKGRKRFQAYPINFENKIGFDKVRVLITQHTESPMGEANIAKLGAVSSWNLILKRLTAVEEMKELLLSGIDFPSLRFSDLSRDIKAIEVEGSYISSERLLEFLLFLRASEALRLFFMSPQGKNIDEKEDRFSTLRTFLLPGIENLKPLLDALEKIIDRYGAISDKASETLYEIRKEIERIERQNGAIARQVLIDAIAKGWAEEGALPTLREGHIVIPISPAYKRMIKGVVFDESATGKTLFVEPLEVIENNNRLRELHADEKREVIRILVAFADRVRPLSSLLLSLYLMVGVLDGIKAIALFAIEEGGVVPRLHKLPVVRWKGAKHPILRRSLMEQKRAIVPLDIELHYPEQRILVISGPNAGGKSVCLKTVAILQYMLQCGIPIPVDPDSEAGIFDSLAINIGDDQSIEDDLSTYSSHLKAMATFCKLATPYSLLLVDEFGAGTEPELGGAIAEALLARFNEGKSFALITTHYRNLKKFASQTCGIINGAMLYNRSEMRPLFRLSIGQPGSSFAIEIAKRSGIPNEVLQKAKNKVGNMVVDSDSYVQDIARDKSYWQRKRDEVNYQSKKLEEAISVYQSKIATLEKEQKKILREAKDEASLIVKNSNALIERTIREIKESEARREETRQARQKLTEHLHTLQREENPIAREENIKEKKKNKNINQLEFKQLESSPKDTPSFAVGDVVKILPEGVEALIVALNKSEARLVFGNSLSILKPLSSLEHTKGSRPKRAIEERKSSNITEHIHEKRVHFSEEIDVRGMRAIEALRQVEYFIDEALQVGSARIKILHGTGTGVLRQTIRDYLSSSPLVSHYEDEDVRFGGAGITIVYL